MIAFVSAATFNKWRNVVLYLCPYKFLLSFLLLYFLLNSTVISILRMYYTVILLMFLHLPIYYYTYAIINNTIEVRR